MNKIAILSGATAILAALSVPAFAQTELAAGSNVAGVSEVDDQISDIEDDVEDSFARSEDVDRFGPSDRRQGLFGTMSLSYTGRTGNIENQDFALAGRVQYNQGVFSQSIGLSIEYGEDDDGDADTQETNAIYDAQYYFNDRLYGFALGRFSVDGLVDGYDNSDDTVRDFDEDDDLRLDGFLGFGPGYRVVSTDVTTWRVQGGIGVRYTQTGEQYIDDESDTDLGYILSSRFYHRFNDMIFLTNDTDYLASDAAGDVLDNVLALNFKMTDSLATRLSLDTEYQTDRAIATDNTLGISVVYGF